MTQPLVSVITPTANRPEMLERCVRMFLAQDYENKEMVISFSQTDEATQMLCNNSIWNPKRQNIKFVFQHERSSIGATRNQCIQYTNGSIMLHMDDDDLYAPDWISKSVQCLQESGAQLVGLSTAHFHDVVKNEMYLWSPQPKRQIWLVGASMCYYKSAWERVKFPDTSAGEERLFQSNIHGAVNPYTDGFLATLHGGNTESHKALWVMKKLPQNEAALICDRFYR